jgi:hypothetical protein
MRSLAALLVTTAAACGGGGPDAPDCGAGQVIASGDPDGGQLGISFTADNYSFVNALGGAPGTLDAQMSGTGTPPQLHLEWEELVADGDSTDARGNIVDGAGYGNCDGGPLDSTISIDAEAGGGTFVLRHLRMGPPFCGEEITGEIVGCFKSPN